MSCFSRVKWEPCCARLHASSWSRKVFLEDMLCFDLLKILNLENNLINNLLLGLFVIPLRLTEFADTIG